MSDKHGWFAAWRGLRVSTGSAGIAVASGAAEVRTRYCLLFGSLGAGPRRRGMGGRKRRPSRTLAWPGSGGPCCWRGLRCCRSPGLRSSSGLALRGTAGCGHSPGMQTAGRARSARGTRGRTGQGSRHARQAGRAGQGVVRRVRVCCGQDSWHVAWRVGICGAWSKRVFLVKLVAAGRTRGAASLASSRSQRTCRPGPHTPHSRCANTSADLVRLSPPSRAGPARRYPLLHTPPTPPTHENLRRA